MDLKNLSYVPTLSIRASEMNGLEKLPGPTKDKIRYPMFLLAPWVSSNSLTSSIDRIQKAFPKRPYFLDLDRHYEPTNFNSSAQIELKKLRSSLDSYNNWCEFISEFEFIHPCLQYENLTEPEILKQINKIQKLGKFFCVRIELDSLGRVPDNLSEILSSLNKIGTADYAILVEGGWTNDPLSTQMQLNSLIKDQLSNIDAQIPIIVSYTTIPKSFAEIEGTEKIAFGNRQHINDLRRNTNRANLIYGDWASTRPREKSMARKPLPRIDYPDDQSWTFSRNKIDKWTYKDAAAEITKSQEWKKNYGLGIWGEQMIEQTTLGDDLGINTPQKNVASRVNIHLHRQAFYDADDIRLLNLDEPWED